jgi:hypothetical protein
MNRELPSSRGWRNLVASSCSRPPGFERGVSLNKKARESLSLAVAMNREFLAIDLLESIQDTSTSAPFEPASVSI